MHEIIAWGSLTLANYENNFEPVADDNIIMIVIKTRSSRIMRENIMILHGPLVYYSSIYIAWDITSGWSESWRRARPFYLTRKPYKLDIARTRNRTSKRMRSGTVGVVHGSRRQTWATFLAGRLSVNCCLIFSCICSAMALRVSLIHVIFNKWLLTLIKVSGRHYDNFYR
jgi:hypothetical protein